MPEHEAIAPETTPQEPLFEFPEDELDDDAARVEALRERMRTVARQAALDPGDHMEI